MYTQNGSSYSNAGNLQLYWRFEEGAGLTTADLSANGHDGLLIAGDSVDSWGINPPGSGSDSDGDGILDGFDNCPIQFNPGQEDSDFDQIGDACDSFPDDPDNAQAQCQEDLATCIATGGTDQDSDGEPDITDVCLNSTPPVDSDGCDLDQFCSATDATTRPGKRTCRRSDWQNDEPLMRRAERDCTVDRGARGTADDLCVPQ